MLGRFEPTATGWSARQDLVSGRTCEVRLQPEQVALLVSEAKHGDRRAWERLVDEYVGLIWAVARAHRLTDGDAHDVTQTTWLRLIEHIDRLSEPSSVGAWLATTARRECLRLLRQSKRTVLLDQWDDLDHAGWADQDVDASLLRREEQHTVQHALEQLNPSAQALLRMLMLDPAPSYEEISAALGMPIGSIGPTRGRLLRKLQALLDQGGINHERRRVASE